MDSFYFLVFFFFQAEDGIRDADVTGVQTCALPIYSKLTVTVQLSSLAADMETGYRQGFDAGLDNLAEVARRTMVLQRRSEEHTSELQSRPHLVCRLLLEKKKKKERRKKNKKRHRQR